MKKILVRIPQWLGDSIVSTIFVKRLKAKEPESEISVLCKPSQKPIFESHPDVASVVVLPAPYKWQVRQVGHMVRSLKFDEFYVLPRSLRTALEAWFSGIPKRIGFGGDLKQLLFTDRIPHNRALKYPHRYLSLIQEENLSLSDTPPHFPSSLPTSSEIEQLGIQELIDSKTPLLGMGPLSIAPARTWNLDQYAELAKRFQKEKKGDIFLLGARNEIEKLNELKKKIGGKVFCDAGNFSFASLGWLMKRLTCYVGNDSGLMHVASAFEVPSIILFGASDPGVALPVTKGMQFIQHRDISCVPCYKNECRRTGDGYLECLKSISLDEAWMQLSSIC